MSTPYVTYEGTPDLESIKFRNFMPMPERLQALREVNLTDEFLTLATENSLELQSSKDFKLLIIAAADKEESLQKAIRLYNTNTACLNQKITSFPIRLVAARLHIKTRELIN
jgi:hypothetical protein